MAPATFLPSSPALGPKSPEPHALLWDQQVVAEGVDRTVNMILPILFTTEAGGLWKEGCGAQFRVLTKLGISSKLQDLLILWGKEILRGYQSPVTSPLPLAQILW